MTRQCWHWRGRWAYVAASLADATRWLAWWSMKLLVDWGTVLSGCRPPELEVDPQRPRPLRHEVALRREVGRGIAEIESYLSTTPAAEVHPPPPTRLRRPTEGVDG